MYKLQLVDPAQNGRNFAGKILKWILLRNEYLIKTLSEPKWHRRHLVAPGNYKSTHWLQMTHIYALLNWVIITETKMSSFWWKFHHWLHRKLSFWQLSVQPVMKISSKWRHFRFSDFFSAMAFLEPKGTYCLLNPDEHNSIFFFKIQIFSFIQGYQFTPLHPSSPLPQHRRPLCSTFHHISGDSVTNIICVGLDYGMDNKLYFI